MENYYDPRICECSICGGTWSLDDTPCCECLLICSQEHCMCKFNENEECPETLSNCKWYVETKEEQDDLDKYDNQMLVQEPQSNIRTTIGTFTGFVSGTI